MRLDRKCIFLEGDLSESGAMVTMWRLGSVIDLIKEKTVYTQNPKLSVLPPGE